MPKFTQRKFSPKFLKVNIKKHFCHITNCVLYTFWVATLNLILIIMCNPTIVNPGPTQKRPQVSVLFHNIRGFTPPNKLGQPNPAKLNTNKIAEFQSYLFDKKPDIVILNETWLSKNIHDSEIFPNNSYKIYRMDRSRKTHPIDPNDPDKFKKNGGGVLIAVKSNLNVEYTLIKTKCKAEIISVEISLGGGKFVCLSTFYRVGNLGDENHRVVDNYLRNLVKRKNTVKLF